MENVEENTWYINQPSDKLSQCRVVAQCCAIETQSYSFVETLRHDKQEELFYLYPATRRPHFSFYDLLTLTVTLHVQ